MKKSFTYSVYAIATAFAMDVSAQSLPANIMPPTNFDVPNLRGINDTNPQPMGDYTNLTFAWTASKSTDIDHYNFYMSSNLPWRGTLIGRTTNLFYTVSITNTVMGFPGVSAVDTNGLESGIML